MAANGNFENNNYQHPAHWHQNAGYPGAGFANYNESLQSPVSAHPFQPNAPPAEYTNTMPPYYYDASSEPHAQEKHDSSSGFPGFPYGAEASSAILSPHHSQPQGSYPFPQDYRSDSQNSLTSGDVYAVSSPSYTHQHTESPFQSPDVSQTPRRTESAPNFNHPQFPSPIMTMRPEDQQPAYPQRQNSAGLDMKEESMSPMSDTNSPMSKAKARFQTQTLGKKPTGIKKNHNQIERDYRTKLNDNVWSLGELAIDGIISKLPPYLVII
jgi:hypothetical protein